MKFEPKTEKEIQEDGLWPAGEYGFEVLDSVTLGGKVFATCERLSKIKPDGSGGQEMIQLVTKVYNAEGNFRIIIDYLMASVAYKLRHAADACGLLDKYEAGQITAEDFKGKSGNLTLRIKKGTEEYPNASNAIADYIVGKKADLPNANAPLSTANNGASSGFVDDSIPF